MSSKELAELADVFDANYTADGRYRGNSILDYKSGKTVPAPGTQGHKKATSNSGVGHGNAQHESQGQGYAGPKNKNAAGQGQGQGLAGVPITVKGAVHNT